MLLCGKLLFAKPIIKCIFEKIIIIYELQKQNAS